MTEEIPTQDTYLNVRVDTLIDHDKQWHVDQVRECVTTLDVECILRMPIPMMEEPDKLVWSYTKSGTTTV